MKFTCVGLHLPSKFPSSCIAILTSWHENLHPRKLTCPLKRCHFRRKESCGHYFFRGHVTCLFSGEFSPCPTWVYIGRITKSWENGLTVRTSTLGCWDRAKTGKIPFIGYAYCMLLFLFISYGRIVLYFIYPPWKLTASLPLKMDGKGRLSRFLLAASFRAAANC